MQQLLISRRSHQRALEAVQTTLHAETNARQEAYRQKKKMDGDINDFQIKLAQANKHIEEVTKAWKHAQHQIKVGAQSFQVGLAVIAN